MAPPAFHRILSTTSCSPPLRRTFKRNSIRPRIRATAWSIASGTDGRGRPSIATSARFVRPIRFGDDIMVESTIRFKTSSFHVDHRVIKTGDLAAEGAETRVWVITDPADPAKLKAAPIPRELIDRMTVG